jgi:hypothetical protein
MYVIWWWQPAGSGYEIWHPALCWFIPIIGFCQHSPSAKGMVGHFPSPQATSHVDVPLYTTCFTSCWRQNICLNGKIRCTGHSSTPKVCQLHVQLCAEVNMVMNPWVPCKEHWFWLSELLASQGCSPMKLICQHLANHISLIYIFKGLEMGRNRISHSLWRAAPKTFITVWRSDSSPNKKHKTKFVQIYWVYKLYMVLFVKYKVTVYHERQNFNHVASIHPQICYSGLILDTSVLKTHKRRHFYTMIQV